MSSDQPIRAVKVAVIGTGLAGLTSALVLASANERCKTSGVHFDVHLFEKADAVGMDAHSVTVPVDGEKVRIDVPMRSFQGGYYSNLLALYKFLGVDYREANFSYSFSKLAFSIKDETTLSLKPYLIYEGRSGRNGMGVPSSWMDSDAVESEFPTKSPMSMSTSRRSQGRMWRILYTATTTLPRILSYISYLLLLLYFFIRLNVLSISMLWNHDSMETLGEWATRTTPSNPIARALGLDEGWRGFVQDVIVPLFSCVCTAPDDDVYRHPVNEILEYILVPLFTSHYVVKSGVADAVRRIIQPIPTSNLHLSSNITSIEPDSPGSSSVTINFTSKFQSLVSLPGFQHVILATQANQAIPLLSTLATSYTSSPSQRHAVEAQIRCLNKFKYVPNIVVNHTDETFLPERESDRRDLNLVMGTKSQNYFALENAKSRFSTTTSWSKEPCLPTGYAMATHLIRSPSSSGTSSMYASTSNPTYIMQTTDPIRPPNPSSIISIARLERAVLTPESKLAQRELMTVGTGRWVFGWRGFSSGSWSWRPFTVDYHRPHALGRLQGPSATRRAVVEQGLMPCLSRDAEASNTGGDNSQTRTGAGVWLCGSYAHPGIPLLEACVNSALNVVENGVFAVEGVDFKAEWAVR